MNVIDLFPRSIVTATLSTLTPDLIRRAIEHLDRAEKVLIASDGGYTAEQHLLDGALFADVRGEIVGLCKQLSEAYGHAVDDIGIANSWGNVLAEGESIRPHKHNNSYISGSFYLTGGSMLAIASPGYHELFGLMPKVAEPNYRSWESFCIRPEPGGIVLFPSGMYHSVLPVTGREKRYSIAFNAIPRGVIGVPTGLIDLGPR